MQDKNPRAAGKTVGGGQMHALIQKQGRPPAPRAVGAAISARRENSSSWKAGPGRRCDEHPGVTELSAMRLAV